MDFEKAYESYKAGTATSEEEQFVKAEIEKARKLTALIDGEQNDREIVQSADMEDVKKAKAKHGKKSILKTVAIVLICLLVSTAAVCGGVFGKAAASAKSNLKVDTEQAKLIAIAFVSDHYAVSDATPMVKKVDRNLEVRTKLSHSTYAYYVEIQNGARMEIELIVDAKTGIVTIEEVDVN